MAAKILPFLKKHRDGLSVAISSGAKRTAAIPAVKKIIDQPMVQKGKAVATENKKAY